MPLSAQYDCKADVCNCYVGHAYKSQVSNARRVGTHRNKAKGKRKAAQTLGNRRAKNSPGLEFLCPTHRQYQRRSHNHQTRPLAFFYTVDDNPSSFLSLRVSVSLSQASCVSRQVTRRS